MLKLASEGKWEEVEKFAGIKELDVHQESEFFRTTTLNLVVTKAPPDVLRAISNM